MIIDEYISYLQYEVALAPLTIKAYAADLRQWQYFVTSEGRYDFVVDEISQADLRQWLAKLSREGISARSVKRKAAALNGFFRWLLKRNLIEKNPAADIQLARAPKTLPSVIPEAQTAAVLCSQPDNSDFIEIRNYLALDMLYQTGMRASELVNLLDSNVDAKAGILRVIGKRNKERVIPFGDELAKQINAYRTIRAQSCQSISTPCFFVGVKGQSIDYKTVLRLVHEALDGRVSCSKRSPHVLRHSFATDMLNHGADLNNLRQLLGHESLETTQIYTHISLNELKQNYQLAHPRAQKKGGYHGS